MTDREYYYTISNKLDEVIILLIPCLKKEKKTAEVKRLQDLMAEVDDPDAAAAVAEADKAWQKARSVPMPHPTTFSPSPPTTVAGAGHPRVKAVTQLEPAEKFSFSMDSKAFAKWKKEAGNYATESNFRLAGPEVQVQYFEKLITDEALERLTLEGCGSFMDCIKAVEQVHQKEWNPDRLRAVFFSRNK